MISNMTNMFFAFMMMVVVVSGASTAAPKCGMCDTGCKVVCDTDADCPGSAPLVATSTKCYDETGMKALAGGAGAPLWDANAAMCASAKKFCGPAAPPADTTTASDATAPAISTFGVVSTVFVSSIMMFVGGAF